MMPYVMVRRVSWVALRPGRSRDNSPECLEISPAGPLEDRHLSTQDNEQKGTAWLRCLQAMMPDVMWSDV